MPYFKPYKPYEILYISFHPIYGNFFDLYSQYSETIRSGRPGQGIGPFTVGDHVFQVQSGFLYSRFDADKTSRDGNNTALSSVIRYGLTRTFEISAALEITRNQINFDNADITNTGLSQADIGFRVNIYEGKGMVPSVGFQSRLKLNIQDESFNPDNLGYVFLFSAGQKLSETFSLTTNLGAVWNGNDPDPRGIYSLTFPFP